MRDATYAAIVPVLRRFNAALRAVSALAHRLQYHVEGLLRPQAEWFDHELDLQWGWPRRGRLAFVERGVLNGLAIAPGARVLDVCCGDGSAARRFYAVRAGEVVGVDRNAEALAHARRFHDGPNIRYERHDITVSLPGGPFDNVVWDAALPHFTAEETDTVLRAIRGVLRPGGVLSGYTDVEPEGTYAYNMTPVRSGADLRARLAPHFSQVVVLHSTQPDRENLFFFAGDDAATLPLAVAPGRDGAV